MSAEQRFSLRESFGAELCRLGEQDPTLVVLDADCQASTGTRLFQKQFPARFIDVGIREQLLVCVAAGLELAGFRAICVSFAMFLFRGAEPIRQIAGIHRVRTVYVGTHYGISCGEDGKSHQMLEDLAFFRTLPEILILAPADREELRHALRQAIAHERSSYLRIPRSNLPDLATLGSTDHFEPIRVLHRGRTPYVIISIGTLTPETVEALKRLRKKDQLDPTHLHLGQLWPVPSGLLDELREVERVVVIEDHLIYGGVATILADLITEHRLPDLILDRIGMEGYGDTGSAAELLRWFELDAEGIYHRLRSILPLSVRLPLEERTLSVQQSCIELCATPSFRHIGIGTGSTVNLLIEELARNRSVLLDRSFIASSVETDRRMQNLGFHSRLIEPSDQLDVYYDSADWVDPRGRLIKGYGNSQLLEHRCIAQSTEILILVDQSKLTASLLDHPIPIEYHPRDYSQVRMQLEQIFRRMHRSRLAGRLRSTDLGNHTLLCEDLIEPLTVAELIEQLQSVPEIRSIGIFDIPRARLSFVIAGQKQRMD